MKERNRSIDIFRYVCAIMVLSIHTHPLAEFSSMLGYFTTEILPRVAVPFFFLVSGYFYIKGLEKGKRVFLPYVIRLLKTYALWSAVYFAIDFVKWGYEYPKAFVVHCVYNFCIAGSHYHFWFFPALLFAVCLTTFLYRLGCRKLLIPLSAVLYVIGCLGCSYHTVGMRIPVLSALFASDSFTLIRRIVMMGFPFFAAGAIVPKLEAVANEHRIPSVRLLWVLFGMIACFLAEIFAVHRFALQESIVITFGLYFLTITVLLVLLRFPMPKHRELSEACHLLADITYYAHPLVIMVLKAAASYGFSAAIQPTPLFLSALVITYLLGTVVRACKAKRKAF